MGLKLKIVPGYTIDPSPGDVSINSMTMDSSIQMTTPDDLLFYNGHMIVDRNANGLSTVKYTDSGIPTLKDTEAITGGVNAIEIHDDLLYVLGNNDTIYSIDVNETTGALSINQTTTLLSGESITFKDMASTSTRLVVWGGNKEVYSFSANGSGALTYDTSLKVFRSDGYLTSIAGNGRHNFLAWQLWNYNGGTFKYDDTTLWEVEVSAGYIGTRNTWDKDDWPINAEDGWIYCPDQSLERAAVKVKVQPLFYLFQFIDSGFSTPTVYADSVDGNDAVAMDPNSEVLVTSGTDLFNDPKFYLYQDPPYDSEVDALLEKEPGGTLHYDSGMVFIDSSGYKFAASDTAGGEIINYNIDVSIYGGGDASIVGAGSKLSISPSVINYNVLDFAGSDYVSVSSFSTNGTTMDISLNMYIDEDIGSGGPYTLWAFSNHANHQFEAFINTGRLYLSHDFSGSGEKFYVDLSAENMLGRIMDIKVHRTSGDVYSLTVDGVSKSLTEGTQTAGGWSTGSHFGAREGSSRFLTKATMWNIYLSADAAESFWYGYPDGNTNGAWLDQISSKNGTVSGSPNTRNIQDSTQGSGSKLIMTGGETTITALYFELDGINDDYIKLPANLGSDITGDKRITFNGYRHIYETHTMFWFNFWDSTSDYLRMTTTGNQVHIYMDDTGGGKYYTVADLTTGGLMEMEIIKTGSVIASFKINGIEQTADGNTSSGTNYTISYAAGGGNQSLDNVSVWDMKIYDSSVGGTLTHWWKGTGVDADKDSAWTDQVGALDGSVFGQSLSTVDITY